MGFFTDTLPSWQPGAFVARCSCGWKSEPVQGRYAADCAGDEHVELAHEAKEESK